MRRRISRFGNLSPRATLAAEADQARADYVSQRPLSERAPWDRFRPTPAGLATNTKRSFPILDRTDGVCIPPFLYERFGRPPQRV